MGDEHTGEQEVDTATMSAEQQAGAAEQQETGADDANATPRNDVEQPRDDGLRSTVVWRAPKRLGSTGRIGAIACGVAVLAIVAVAVLHASGGAKTSSLQNPGDSIPSASSSLADDTQLTTPAFSFPEDAPQGIAVAPIFAAYYAAHGGAALFGAPITPAYPTAKGTAQFFTAGGLITTATPTTASATASTAVQRLPVVSTLLEKGSLARIGGGDGSLTYASLRSAALPTELREEPSPLPTSGVFIGEGHRDTTVIGHTIAQQFYDYITDPDVSPNGWQEDVGLPLTEALSGTVTVNGSAQTLLVQVFTNVALALDLSDPTATVAPVEAGIAYLQTLAPPEVELSAGASLWATGSVAITTQAAGGSTSVHIGQNFALTAVSDGTTAQWVNGALWYHVRWSAPKRNGEGWAPASAMTLTPPGNAPAYASFDALSPDLENYLAGYGGNDAAVVFDETRNVYYTYNPTGAFTLASSAKVPIMLTFLTMTERQGREPNANEMATLTTMIENSNNDSAEARYEEEGEDNAIRAFLTSVAVNDWTPNPDGWGWSTFSPTSMVHLLTLLHDGKVLTAQDRALALNLMEHIELDEQVGVGDTAPAGATVAMKDGWVTGPDGLWAVNSSGIVTVGGETYIIAVYSQHFGDITTGWGIVRTVAGDVGKAIV